MAKRRSSNQAASGHLLAKDKKRVSPPEVLVISRSSVQDLVASYDPGAITVGTLGSHSALDIADGAHDEGFRTVVVCQQGREGPYRSFNRIVDEVLVLPNFSEVASVPVQAELRRRNVIFVPHRAFTTYVGYAAIEETFMVPLFGNRALLRAEERSAARNQYHLLARAGIRMPKVVQREAIDRPVMIKVQEAKRRAERAFFVANSSDDFEKKASEKVKAGLITEEDLKSAVIEEYVVGTYFNFNYFYSPLSGETEFLGIDRRLQTNLHDFVSLPAREQLEIGTEVRNIEIGHTPATIRESMLGKVFDMGERFVKSVREEYGVGPIGPFALQGAVTVDLDIVIFDVSPRVPGSPLLATTSPYSKYYHGEVVGTGRRIAMELRRGAKEGRLRELVT